MSNPKITLYHANWSFCSQMVRVALLEKDFSFNKCHIKLCDQYPEGENIDKDKKSVAIKVLFEPTDKTLNDKEIDELSDKIILAAKSLGGSLRSQ